jgi:DNA-binding LytR/AlgR family response regulator
MANSALDYVLNNVLNVFNHEYIEKNYAHYLCADLLITFMVGIIPTVTGYFFINNSIIYFVSREKENVLRFRDNNISKKKIITLSGNTKDMLTLLPNELIYIEASGNYVNIHYRANGQIAEKILRATLTQMEEQLGGYQFLVRCHRAFIVNMDCIENIKGRKIRLKSMNTEIPVSKTCKDNLIK